MNIESIHPAAWSALQARRAQLPHALLLAGQGGLGKLALAQAFAGALLCEAPTAHGGACGSCPGCHWYVQGNHPDFRLLQPEALDEEAASAEDGKKASQQITIAQVRALDDFLTVGTHRAGLRIVLIHPAEAMNRNTANALLKSLEEPPPGTLFLLVSSEPLRLLPTLRSRCQVVSVAVPPAALSAPFLAAEGVAEPKRWLAMAGGAPFSAKALAESAGNAWLRTLNDALAAGAKVDALGAAAALEKLVKEGKGKLPLKALVETQQKWLLDLTLASHAQPARYFVGQQETIDRLAGMIPPVRLLRAYRSLVGRRREAEQPLNPRLFIESLLLDYRDVFAAAGGSQP